MNGIPAEYFSRTVGLIIIVYSAATNLSVVFRTGHYRRLLKTYLSLPEAPFFIATLIWFLFDVFAAVLVANAGYRTLGYVAAGVVVVVAASIVTFKSAVGKLVDEYFALPSNVLAVVHSIVFVVGVAIGVFVYSI